MKNISLGAHLVCTSTRYEHHGIYIGDNNVIHYMGWDDSKKVKKPIVKTSLENFCAGNPTFVISHKSPKYKENKVIERAKVQLNSDQYNIIFNNCEHFARWCIYGKKKSNQILLNGITIGQLIIMIFLNVTGIGLGTWVAWAVLGSMFGTLGITSIVRLDDELNRKKVN